MEEEDDVTSDEERILICKVLRDEDDIVSTFQTSVNSVLLSEKSEFFDKLFNGGLKESGQKTINIIITQEEKESFQKLLEWVKCDQVLKQETSLDLLEIAKVSDKFGAVSCVEQCCDLLLSRPMTKEVAKWLLDSNLLVLGRVCNAAKNFVVQQFNKVPRFEKDICELPYDVLEMILCNDSLEVNTERDVLNLAISWVETNLEVEDRAIALEGLIKHIRFPFMGVSDLRELLEFKDLGTVIIEALFSKVEGPHPPVERCYTIRPVKMLELGLPHPACYVFWDITLPQLKEISNGEKVNVESFKFNGYTVKMYLEHILDAKTSDEWLGLIMIIDSGDRPYSVQYNISCRETPTEDFGLLLKGKHSWRKKGDQMKVGRHKMLAWKEVVTGDNRYVIKGGMYFRITLRKL